MTRLAALAALGVCAYGATLASAEVPLPVPRPPEFGTAPVVPDVPLPPPRPPDLDTASPAPPPTVAITPEIPGACQHLFAEGRILGAAAPAITGPGSCGIAGAVDLKGFVLPDGSTVALRPAQVMRCSLAGALATWVRDDLAPAFAADGAALIAIEDTGGYECRTRDHLTAEQLSEHALGNALDLGTFARRNGAALTLHEAKATPLMTQIRDSACRRFDTVLGPGSDAFHGDHLHVDLRVRRSGLHICQWDLPAP